MTTLNTVYRSKKFFLCIHQAPKGEIGFEKAEERFTKFTYFQYGSGKFHVLVGENFKSFECLGSKKLYDLTEWQNMNVVCQATENSRFISFNPWRKEEKWSGELLDQKTKQIKSNHDYSCIVCFEGSVFVNGKELNELTFVDLKKDVDYSLSIPDDCYAGFFQLCV